jgi:putative transposase
MTYPLVADLAAGGVPVAVTCRVLGFSKQAYYAWVAAPVTRRDLEDAYLINAAVDIHRDDPAFGHRFIADELPARGVTAGVNRVARLCTQQRIWSVFAKKKGPHQTCRTAGARRPRAEGIHRRRSEPNVADRHHRTPHRRGQALSLRDQGHALRPDRRLLDQLTHDRVVSGVGIA